MKAPTTDRTLGVSLYHHERFSEVRKRATDDYIERAKRKKREKSTPVPKHKPEDVIVIIDMDARPSRAYLMVEIIDFEYSGCGLFSYYGVVLKTSDKRSLPRIGRLHYIYCYQNIEVNVTPESIRWAEALEKGVIK